MANKHRLLDQRAALKTNFQVARIFSSWDFIVRGMGHNPQCGAKICVNEIMKLNIDGG